MANEKWYINTKKADFNAIGEQFQISPILARIIRNRDVITAQEVDYYLNGTLADLHDPHTMKDMDKGARLLWNKIKEGKSIRIIGDYDVDGICSTFLLKKGITSLKGKASAAIPHRIKDGYGLNEHLILEAAGDAVDTIVTCDNGIAAAKEIYMAKEKGMTVVVTDHHEVPYREEEAETASALTEKTELLPPADAVIDPKQAQCSYPYKGICGAVIAYKLIQVLCELAEQERCISRQETTALLEELLEFAAFATICDVMELKDENRIIVKYGLAHMKQSANLGLRSLIAINGLDGKKITSYHVGFVLGPCLNATGRLESAEHALALLDADTQKEADVLAAELKEMNESRKEMTENGVQKAVEMVESGAFGEDRVMVIYLPDCHESIAGIIAGRLRERYNKPFLVLTDAEEGVKGSGRSIDAYHMYEGLHQVEDLFSKYGGHKLAAGVSLKKEKVEELRRRLNENCTLGEDDMARKVMIDVPMPIQYATMPLVESFSLLEPFGMGNAKPVFAQKHMRIERCQVRGKNRNVAGFVLVDEKGNRADGIYFGEADLFQEEFAAHGDVADILYYPEINEFRGQRSLQLVVTGYQF